MNTADRILRLFSCVLVALLVPATSHAATPNREPKPHTDAADAAPSPLDIRSYAMGQRGTDLVLRITTAGEWEASQLAPGSGRALCVRFFYGTLPTPRGRICVVERGGDAEGDEDRPPVLAYSRLDPFGVTVESVIVDADVHRPSKRSVEAVFAPSAVNLTQGRYSWQVQSEWSCAVPASCSDLAPDRGNVIAQIRPLAEPACFGAASRNPRYRCRNRELRRAVVPSPQQAAVSPNSPCTIVSLRVPYTCGFGVRPNIANRTIALIGDSHAAHWRGALEVVAQARRWRGYSLTRAGCPLSTATPAGPKARRDSCARWRQAVHNWFKRRPEVQTVFVSQLAGLGVRAPAGRNARNYEIQGFIRAWLRLPRTVRQVIVLRDTPVTTSRSPLCVERAVRARRATANVCAIARTRALRRDPAAVAANRTRARRVHLFDLTRHMCGPRWCFPVVGGVLVHKDTTHMTNMFATTLGPFVMQRVDRLLGARR
ncbi:MAG: SGNH hydrolase domain-containing protein [Solirubrobacteraceae bacterium]|nr:SGNH hydrolase domain-containing protein [Solirubrobacteraceae bacterium]